jgi:hypothetical protein
MLTGKRYSPRLLGFEVDVTPNGSNCLAAVQTAEGKGLVLYELWPTPDSFTWEQYYANPPSPLPRDFYKIEIVRPDLNVSPIWTELLFLNGARHMVAQINENQYFDSELGSPVKPLNYENAQIVSQVSLQITPVNVQDWYVKSTGFTPEQFASFTAEVQAAIKFNDQGGKNIIYAGQILARDPNFTYHQA